MFAQESAQEIIGAAFDPLLLERLMIYARRRLARAFGQHLEAAEDYVNRAIELTLSGKRRCDPASDMFRHLGGVISSLVSHDARSEANRATVGWPTADGGQPVDFASDRPSAEETLVERDVQHEQNTLVVRVLDMLQDEPDLARFVRMLMAAPDLPPPRQMALRLGVQVDEIYSMRKRLQRRLQFLTKVPS
jgi:hypothetical protein